MGLEVGEEGRARAEDGPPVLAAPRNTLPTAGSPLMSVTWAKCCLLREATVSPSREGGPPVDYSLPAYPLHALPALHTAVIGYLLICILFVVRFSQ